MGEFSLTHILLVLVVLLIFFGPSRLPGLGASFGKAIREFKDGIRDATKDDRTAQNTPPKTEQISARSEVSSDRVEVDTKVDPTKSKQS